MSDIIAEVLKRVKVAKGWVNEEQGSSRRNFFPQKTGNPYLFLGRCVKHRSAYRMRS